MSDNLGSTICWVTFLICLFGMLTFLDYNSRNIELKEKEVQVELKKLELQKLQIIKDVRR